MDKLFSSKSSGETPKPTDRLLHRDGHVSKLNETTPTDSPYPSAQPSPVLKRFSKDTHEDYPYEGDRRGSDTPFVRLDPELFVKNDDRIRHSPRNGDDFEQISLSDNPEYKKEQQMLADIHTQTTMENLGLYPSATGRYGTGDSTQLNSDSMTIDLDDSNTSKGQITPEVLRRRESGDFSGGLGLEDDGPPTNPSCCSLRGIWNAATRPIKFIANNEATSGPGRVACNFTNITVTRGVSVDANTMIRELLRGYLNRLSPLTLGIGAIAAISYPMGLLSGGLVRGILADRKVNQALDQLCIETRTAIQSAAYDQGQEIDTQQLDQLIAEFRDGIANAIEARSKISQEDIAQGVNDRLEVSVLETYKKLTDTLASQSIYLSTKAMTACRVLLLFLLSGLGLTCGFLGWIMPELGLGPLGLLPLLGSALMAFEFWYCPFREGSQMVLDLEDNVRKKQNDDEAGEPHYHIVPTLVTGGGYGAIQFAVNVGMESARGLPEYSTEPMVNTLNECALLGKINGAGECLDHTLLYESHNVHGGTEPLKVTIVPKAITVKRMEATALTIHSARTAIFAIVVMASGLAEVALGLKGLELSLFGGGVLGLLYWALIIMAVGKIFNLGVR